MRPNWWRAREYDRNSCWQIDSSAALSAFVNDGSALLRIIALSVYLVKHTVALAAIDPQVFWCVFGARLWQSISLNYVPSFSMLPHGYAADHHFGIH